MKIEFKKILSFYAWIPLFTLNLIITSEQQFVFLAKSLLEGKLYLTQLPPSVADLSLFNGQYFWPLGPLPAILLVPFALIFQENFFQGFLQFPLNIANFWLVYQVSKKTGLSKDKSLWLTIFFIFGSVYTPIAAIPWSWHFAHVIATSLLLLSLYIFLTKKNWLLIGSLLGLAVATRSNLIVASLFFAVYLIKKPIDYRNLSKLFFPIIASVIIIAGYNYQRFANIFESGYSYQIIPQESEARRNYGLISIRHVPANLYYMLVKTPNPVLADESHVLKFPYLRYDPYGMSIFFMSPILFLIFKAKLNDPYVKASLLTTLAIAATIVTYYGIGYIQVGYRYALDFYPFVLIILASALNRSNLSTIKILTLIGVTITWFFIFEKLSGF